MPTGLKVAAAIYNADRHSACIPAHKRLKRRASANEFCFMFQLKRQQQDGKQDDHSGP